MYVTVVSSVSDVIFSHTKKNSRVCKNDVVGYSLCYDN